MEEELKKDHAEMQAAVDSKQKIIDAQVGSGHNVRELASRLHLIVKARRQEPQCP